MQNVAVVILPTSCREMPTKHDYANNAYWYNGSGKDKYDTSATFTDPQMVAPLNGDFTLKSAEYIDKRIGDPRWLPEEVLE